MAATASAILYELASAALLSLSPSMSTLAVSAQRAAFSALLRLRGAFHRSLAFPEAAFFACFDVRAYHLRAGRLFVVTLYPACYCDYYFIHNSARCDLAIENFELISAAHASSARLESYRSFLLALDKGSRPPSSRNGLYLACRVGFSFDRFSRRATSRSGLQLPRSCALARSHCSRAPFPQLLFPLPLRSPFFTSQPCAAVS